MKPTEIEQMSQVRYALICARNHLTMLQGREALKCVRIH